MGLAWKLMEATEAACQSVCMGEEAAEHYVYSYTLLDRWIDWCRGFVAGWLKDNYLNLPLTQRLWRLVRRLVMNAWKSRKYSSAISKQKINNDR